jgi:hypothetical protein
LHGSLHATGSLAGIATHDKLALQGPQVGAGCGSGVSRHTVDAGGVRRGRTGRADWAAVAAISASGSEPASGAAQSRVEAHKIAIGKVFRSMAASSQEKA